MQQIKNMWSKLNKESRCIADEAIMSSTTLVSDKKNAVRIHPPPPCTYTICLCETIVVYNVSTVLLVCDLPGIKCTKQLCFVPVIEHDLGNRL